MPDLIRYGGAITGQEEEEAIIASIKKSRETRQWQAGEEAATFEQELQDYIGVRHALLTTSGSCAGLLALKALELPQGSEVIIPAVTFPTIFNIIVQCGLKPVVVDVEVGTYNLDLEKVRNVITHQTKAIIAVHTLGNPCDMRKLHEIAQNNNLILIEDNCDGLSTTLEGKQMGSWGDISFTSFHAAHIVSMGVGGGVFTNHKHLADRVRVYRDWGRQSDIDNKWNNQRWPELPPDQDSRFIYEKIGYNFQILDMQAAMGRVQLRKVNETKNARKKNAAYLFDKLHHFSDLIMPYHPDGADVCWFAVPLSTKGNRKPLMVHLEKHGIETRSMFSGNILRHPAYQSVDTRSSSLENADWILEHSFWISCHPALTQEELDRIVNAFKTYYGQTT